MSDLFCSRASILRPTGAAILVTALSMTGACASSAKQVSETTPQSSARAARSGSSTALAANRNSAATGAACQLEAVYYDTDSADLDEAAREALNQNAECLRADPKRGAAVVGMTDPRGTEEYNIALGERRARAAVGYVAALGVDGQRLRAHSVGEEYALGTDETLWGRDRRSEFKQE